LQQFDCNLKYIIYSVHYSYHFCKPHVSGKNGATIYFWLPLSQMLANFKNSSLTHLAVNFRQNCINCLQDLKYIATLPSELCAQK